MSRDAWPALEYAEWADTLTTLHMWCQIVGKIRLACSPWTNHQWHSTLYVTPTGLRTSAIPHGARRFDLEMDLVEHRLSIRSGEGHRRFVELRPRTVASFYQETIGHLSELELPVDIYATPNEVADPVAFADDTTHASYDGEAAARFVRALNQSAAVFTEFRAKYRGKCSPVHLFWGAFDLAVTRFSGRRAPEHPGGIVGLPDWITREAYSHEVYSCGFWPGSAESPAAAYYAYGYPTPEGLAAAKVRPSEAYWSDEMGEFFLPYDAVRTAPDPAGALSSFLESTYDAVASLGSWDREELEVPEGFPHRLWP